MLESKKVDKMKLLKENNKFLAASGEKYSWHTYESMLANERVANQRLQAILLKKNNINTLLDEGAKCTYEEYLKKASHFSMGGM